MASLVKKAAALRIRALSLAGEMKSGSFRSLYRGRGIEFSGVREYVLGDDVRTIDWNVTARMGRPFVKVFQEERELSIVLLLDFSRSMGAFGGARPLQSALEAASLLALAADYAGCPVGAVFFAGNLLFSCPPRFGAVMELLARIDSLGSRPQRERGTALPDALTLAFRLLKRRSLVFVFSDFRVSRWERPLAVLASKHDVAAVRVTSPLDARLPPLGRVRFRDPETGLTQGLPTSSRRFRAEWGGQGESRRERWHGECRAGRAFPLELPAGEDPFVLLSRFFRNVR
ncbi:MAG: DUF58 domain-containing protein [Spirochaetaceae bacterium]|jgi:uncharacterized protein (DUF58 family)|nr:DUF58 domain-containing protein [Spirochaetaceae bacterium]